MTTNIPTPPQPPSPSRRRPDSDETMRARARLVSPQLNQGISDPFRPVYSALTCDDAAAANACYVAEGLR